MKKILSVIMALLTGGVTISALGLAIHSAERSARGKLAEKGNEKTIGNNCGVGNGWNKSG